MNVECDCSMESMLLAAGPDLCHTNKLRPGRTFLNSRYGPGKVVGTLNNCRIWYTIDSGECNAWYWTKTELNDLVSSGVVVFESEEKDADEDKKQRAEPAQHSYEAASDSYSCIHSEERATGA